MNFELLFADAQPLDQLGVAIRVFALEVVEQAAALTDELQQTASRVMIFCVRFEVLGQVGDAFAEDGHLHFRGAGIALVLAETLDQVGLAVLRQCHGAASTIGPESSLAGTGPSSS